MLESTDNPTAKAIAPAEVASADDTVMPFRGPRLALRVQAGTGTLLLSFDSKEARDQAAAELIGEAGLLMRDTGIAASPL